MGYIIEKLLLENYEKCNNIWDKSSFPVQSKRWYEELVSGNRITFVCVENGEYLGEASLVFESYDSDYTIPNERIYLSRLIVKSEYRNKGIGSLLINFLIDYAKGLGYKEMSVGVDISNVVARVLYEKNGFINTVFVGEDKAGEYVKLIKIL